MTTRHTLSVLLAVAAAVGVRGDANDDFTYARIQYAQRHRNGTVDLLEQMSGEDQPIVNPPTTPSFEEGWCYEGSVLPIPVCGCGVLGALGALGAAAGKQGGKDALRPESACCIFCGFQMLSQRVLPLRHAH